MLDAVVAADPRLFDEVTAATANGTAVLGFGYEPSYGYAFGLSPPLSFNPAGTATATFAAVDDARTTTDPAAIWQEGWFTAGYWSYWTTPSLAAATDPVTVWTIGTTGFSSRSLSSGAWDGWSFSRGFGDVAPAEAAAVPPLGVVGVPEPATAAASAVAVATLFARRRRRSMAAASAAVAVVVALPRPTLASYTYNPNDFPTAVVGTTGPTDGRAAYDDPTVLLDEPALTFNDSSNPNVQTLESASIVNPPYNYGPGTAATRRPVTLVLPNSDGGSPAIATVTVRFGRPITHDPAHPYGDDLIVFGNSFYTGTGVASDATDLDTYAVGTVFGHPVQVSVSPDDVNWFTFPVLPVIQPYNAYRWDPAAAAVTSEALDPTVPLDPSVYTTDFTGDSAAQVLAAYGDSAGGTALDLADAVDANGRTLFQGRVLIRGVRPVRQHGGRLRGGRRRVGRVGPDAGAGAGGRRPVRRRGDAHFGPASPVTEPHMPPQRQHRKVDRWGAARPAFTLVELLVTIGIVSLLIALLLPSLGPGAVGGQAGRSACRTCTRWPSPPTRTPTRTPAASRSPSTRRTTTPQPTATAGT